MTEGKKTKKEKKWSIGNIKEGIELLNQMVEHVKCLDIECEDG